MLRDNVGQRFVFFVCRVLDFGGFKKPTRRRAKKSDSESSDSDDTKDDSGKELPDDERLSSAKAMADDARDEARGAAADEAAQDCDDGDAARQQATSVLPSPSASSSASSASASMEPRVEGNGGSYGVFRGDCKLGSFWQPRAEHTQAALYMFSCIHMLLEFVLCI